MYDRNINYLFNEVSLYTKEIFKVFNYRDNQYYLENEQLNQFLCYIGCLEERLISYCHQCKKTFPFTIVKNVILYNTEEIYAENMIHFTKQNRFGDGRLSIDNGTILGLQPPYDKTQLLNNHIWYIHYFFSCTNNDSHNYHMIISVELNDGRFIVRKVGQNPSILTIKGFDFDKYKKELKKINAYNDYKKADLCNAEHFYVGAYAYLRRILEKMINRYLTGLEIKDGHMNTKIDATKDKFDPRIQKMLKNLYGILSVSIHELDEEKSKEYYEYLKAIIDIQLEYEKTEDEKENQTKSLEATLNKIKAGIV